MNLLSLGKNTLENTNKLLLLMALLAELEQMPYSHSSGHFSLFVGGVEAGWRAVGGLVCIPEGSCPSLLFPLGSAGVSFSQGTLPGLDGFDLGSPYLSVCVIPCLKRMAGRWCF